MPKWLRHMGNGSLNSEVRGREGEEIVRERWVFRADVGNEEVKMFETMTKIKKIMQEGGRSNLAVFPPGNDLGGGQFRRMLEYIFNGTNIRCHVHTRNGQYTQRTAGETLGNKRREEALVISQEGMSYADLLKTIKQKVKPNSTAAKAIRTVREARVGNKMVMVINKEEGSALRDLEKEIRNLELKITRNNGNDRLIVHIQEIDGTVTKEDIVS